MRIRKALGRTSLTLFLPGLGLCLLAACAQPPAFETTPAPEAQRLQGTWKEGDVSVTIEGNSLYFYQRPDFQYDTIFELIPDTEPAQLRATILDSPRTTDSEGDVVYAIYAFEGEVLRLAAIDTSEGVTPSFDDVDSQYRLERKYGV